MNNRTPDEVFADHLRLRREGDLENDLTRNYAEDIVLLSSFGVFRGHDGVRASAELLRRQMPSTDYAYRVRHVAGEVAFLEWSASSDRARIEDGADSYLIRDGRIRAQTIHYTVTPHPEGQAPHLEEVRHITREREDEGIAGRSTSSSELVSAINAGRSTRH